MLEKFRLLIAVQNPVLCSEIAQIIRDEYPHVIISKMNNGASALLGLDQDSYDLAILQDELYILNGIEVAEKYQKAQKKKVQFILFSESMQMEYFQKGRELNFDAYLTKDDLKNEIKDCLSAVLNDSCFVSKSMQKLIKKFGQLSKKLASLSPTEKLFLNEINEGKNVQEISDKLVLSSKSISQITNSISKKLEIEPEDQSIKEWTQKNKAIFN